MNRTYPTKKSYFLTAMLIASVTLTTGCSLSNDKLIDNPKKSDQLGTIEPLSKKTPIHAGLTAAVYDGLDQYFTNLSKDGLQKVDTLSLPGTLFDDNIEKTSQRSAPVVKKLIYHNIKIGYSTGSLTNDGHYLTIFPALSERPSQSDQKELTHIDFLFCSHTENNVRNDYFYFVAPGNKKISKEIHFDTRKIDALGRNPEAAGDVICEKVDGGIQITYVVNGEQLFSQLIKGDFYGLRPRAKSNVVKATIDVYQ